MSNKNKTLVRMKTQAYCIYKCPKKVFLCVSCGLVTASTSRLDLINSNQLRNANPNLDPRTKKTPLPYNLRPNEDVHTSRPTAPERVASRIYLASVDIHQTENGSRETGSRNSSQNLYFHTSVQALAHKSKVPEAAALFSN